MPSPYVRNAGVMAKEANDDKSFCVSIRGGKNYSRD